jgi:hypothetical protein
MSLKRKPPAGNVRRVAAISGNLRGVITNKVGRVVQFESFAERSLLLRLDRDRTVVDYGSQPETFTEIDEQGQSCRYTPDFVVWRQDGSTEIHEVTVNHRRTQPNSQGRERLAETVCRSRGWRYLVHTEDTLPRGSELANLLALIRYRPEGYAQATVKTAAQCYLAVYPQSRLLELIDHLSQNLPLATETMVSTVLHLLWHGDLATDLDQPLWLNGILNGRACIRLGGGER